MPLLQSPAGRMPSLPGFIHDAPATAKLPGVTGASEFGISDSSYFPPAFAASGFAAFIGLSIVMSIQPIIISS